MRGLRLLAMLALAPAGCATQPLPADAEASVRLIDEQQRRMVAGGDIAGLEALAHADLAINAPGNRILTRDQFLANMRSGEIRAELFQRSPERIRISGKVAIVMGSETFTPAAASELGRTYGAVPLSRRFTNIYVFEDGRWRWLARHANVVPKLK